MFPSRVMVTTMAVAMTTVLFVPIVPTMPVMPVMTVMPVMPVMTVVVVVEQRVEGDEGRYWRHVTMAVMRLGRCTGQRQHNQAASGHNSKPVYPLLSHFCLQSALMTGPL